MAAKEGLGPKELCDKCPFHLFSQLTYSREAKMYLEATDHKLHADSYNWFEIGFDHFGRTSTEKQTEFVFLSNVHMQPIS